MVFSLLAGSLVLPMGILVLLLLARIVLRTTWLAILAITIVISFAGTITTGNPYVDVCFGAVTAILHVILLFRLGFLAIVVAEFAGDILTVFPMTFDAGSWYFGITLLALVVVGALTTFGFRVALAGRPALGASLVPEVRSA